MQLPSNVEVLAGRFGNAAPSVAAFGALSPADRIDRATARHRNFAVDMNVGAVGVDDLDELLAGIAILGEIVGPAGALIRLMRERLGRLLADFDLRLLGRLVGILHDRDLAAADIEAGLVVMRGRVLDVSEAKVEHAEQKAASAAVMGASFAAASAVSFRRRGRLGEAAAIVAMDGAAMVHRRLGAGVRDADRDESGDESRDFRDVAHVRPPDLKKPIAAPDPWSRQRRDRFNRRPIFLSAPRGPAGRRFFREAFEPLRIRQKRASAKGRCGRSRCLRARVGGFGQARQNRGGGKDDAAAAHRLGDRACCERRPWSREGAGRAGAQPARSHFLKPPRGDRLS